MRKHRVSPIFTTLLLLVSAGWALPLNALSMDYAALPESAICIDATTGLTLFEDHADLRRPPASMIKLMLMLLVAEGLEEGRWTETSPVTASAEAQRMGGTQVFLKAGDTHPLERMMEAVAVASANDAAMAVAEGLWGSKAAYLKASNQRARELGMVDTIFRSVHGLPPDDRKTFDLTTARDMALLARACVRHERILAWTGLREMCFTPGQSTHYNTNKLLWRMDDCDGLKTGFIRAAGFCVTATAERDGVRLVAVLMGATSKYGRFNRAEKILEDGFASLRRMRLVKGGTYVGPPLPVEGGKRKTIRLRAETDVWARVPVEARDRVQVVTEQPKRLEAPMKAGTPVGELIARLGDTVLGRCELLLPADLEPDGWRLEMEDNRVYWKGLPESGGGTTR